MVVRRANQSGSKRRGNHHGQSRMKTCWYFNKPLNFETLVLQQAMNSKIYSKKKGNCKTCTYITRGVCCEVFRLITNVGYGNAEECKNIDKNNNYCCC